MTKLPLLDLGIIASLALASCGRGTVGSEEDVEVVRFHLGMEPREMVSRGFYDEHLSPQVRTDGEPFVATIASPHILRITVGSEEIELRPGGYNSLTYLNSGFRRDELGKVENVDYARIGQLTTDSGAHLLTKAAARDLAIRLCAVAERGLNSKSRHDPAKVIDAFQDRDTKKDSPLGITAGDVCVVKNIDTTFVIRLNGADITSNEPSLRKEGQGFRLNISLSQTI